MKEQISIKELQDVIQDLSSRMASYNAHLNLAMRLDSTDEMEKQNLFDDLEKAQKKLESMLKSTIKDHKDAVDEWIGYNIKLLQDRIAQFDKEKDEYSDFFYGQKKYSCHKLINEWQEFQKNYFFDVDLSHYWELEMKGFTINY